MTLAAPPSTAAPTDPGPELRRILDLQRAAFHRDGPPDVELRRDRLRRLRRAIGDRRDEIVAAVAADFGRRSRYETLIGDLMPTVQGIDHAIRNLPRWMRPERRGVAPYFRPGRARVIHQPLGVVGIIASWNYPVFLALSPLVSALAAGNRAMLKPSELTPATSALLAGIIRAAFAPEEVAVVPGGIETGKAFARLPFDHLVFTGSTSVGREVMRAASEHLVPVTLELGGKSPAIVGPGYPLEQAAPRIAVGKLFNAGQTCIAPDYALVPATRVEAFAERFAAAAARCFPRLGGSSDYSPVLNDRHYERLLGLVADARARGARVIEVDPAGEGPALRDARVVPPTLILDPPEEALAMRDEIFGPVLPVKGYHDLEEAIAYVNARPRPLALYVFGDRRTTREVLRRTTSGGVTVNHTMLHILQDDLPFGGVGPSGTGAYHGRDGFRRLSHAKAVFEARLLDPSRPLWPPYGRLADRVLGWLVK
ncbi:MAG TPA: coniferyl aldehyde dehydrogenase [Gemmatimonadales bacterium]|nr:coniferyl aldehyde dehydrogenase [Gemmatimonadales bacterium]